MFDLFQKLNSLKITLLKTHLKEHEVSLLASANSDEDHQKFSCVTVWLKLKKRKNLNRYLFQ